MWLLFVLTWAYVIYQQIMFQTYVAKVEMCQSWGKVVVVGRTWCHGHVFKIRNSNLQTYVVYNYELDFNIGTVCILKPYWRLSGYTVILAKAEEIR